MEGRKEGRKETGIIMHPARRALPLPLEALLTFPRPATRRNEKLFSWSGLGFNGRANNLILILRHVQTAKK